MNDEENDLLERLEVLPREKLSDKMTRALELLEAFEELETLERDLRRKNDTSDEKIARLKDLRVLRSQPLNFDREDYDALELLERTEKMKIRKQAWQKIINQDRFDDPPIEEVQKAIESVMELNTIFYDNSKKTEILDRITELQKARGVPQPLVDNALPVQFTPVMLSRMTVEANGG